MTTHTKTPPQPDADNELDDADYAALEKAWRASLPRYTDQELLTIFPEASAIIPDTLAEWQHERRRLVRRIREKLAVIKRMSAPENQWFWREWVKHTDGRTLLEVDAQVARLRRLHAMATDKPHPGMLTDAHIQQARTVPLTRLVSTPLRKSGKTLVGRCPLHEDRSPSFYVYPATNSWYCYGCQRGGDTIAFVRSLHGRSFREAVHSLIHAL